MWVVRNAPWPVCISACLVFHQQTVILSGWPSAVSQRRATPRLRGAAVVVVRNTKSESKFTVHPATGRLHFICGPLQASYKQRLRMKLSRSPREVCDCVRTSIASDGSGRQPGKTHEVISWDPSCSQRHQKSQNLIFGSPCPPKWGPSLHLQWKNDFHQKLAGLLGFPADPLNYS